MYTVVIERKIGDTQFVTFTGLKAAQKMVDRAKQNSNVNSAVIKEDAQVTARFYTDRSAEHIASLAQEQLMPFVRSQILAEMAEHSEHITLQYSPVHDVVVGFETHTGDNATQFTGV